MRIETLKDLKKVLDSVPDPILNRLGVGVDFDNLEHVTLLCTGTDELQCMKFYSQISEKYPELKEVEKWIINIAQEAIDFDGNNSNLRSSEGFITS